MKKPTARVPPFPTVFSLIAASVFMFAVGDPRSETVEVKCGPNKQDNQTLSTKNFIATMDSISNQLSSGAGFAVASSGSGPDANYALFQCYGDLSSVDCALCHLQARTVLPSCTPSDGGKIFLDGCFMRVETYDFFEEWTGPEDKAICGGNGTRDTAAAAFGGAAQRAVGRSVAEATKGNGYARAEDRAKDSSNVSAFALANCWGTLNKSSCRACLETASASALRCLPRAEGRALKAGCFLRYSDVNFLNPIQETKESSRGKSIITVVAVVVGCTVVLFAGTASVVVYRRKKRKLQKNRRGLIDVKKLVQILNDSRLHFEFTALEKATESFSDDNKLGEGGFGTVYKGVLADGREVAVKKLFFNNKHRAEEFYNEINIISSVEHRNLVRLLGCSFSGTDSLLVYEFMANESLDRHIFDSNKGKALNWEMRFGIIKGTAEGLVYLHENHRNKILHRDIKASNILLDSRFRAKIADFGLARSFQDGKSHISTAVAGTIGYMAPEYLAHGRLSEKVDVYSFGVLLLEIATGRHNNDGSKSSDSLDSLVITVWKKLQQGTVEELFDPNLLSDSYDIKDEVFRVVHIGLLCTQEQPALRPTMSKALQMLKNKEEKLPAPSNPPFVDEQTMEFHDHSSEDPSTPLNSTNFNSTPAPYPLP